MKGWAEQGCPAVGGHRHIGAGAAGHRRSPEQGQPEQRWPAAGGHRSRGGVGAARVGCMAKICQVWCRIDKNIQ